ncbi:4-hydroxythreonine-4-phosphate dehydrogenase PdxA [Candidimonas nitroreducens]|uniref:4-hydroxythreonine-4-phosphate dehydrogenase PdxA n=1 Tax=Candidimonas nitroreducens TaxID=683354 RepID=A0A225M9H8_9BURK|nr:4-hydroxythreonine-4-phosphate dehydrogenase PdxA [Candidimonas nitroreducens]OWT56211.1 4-hydroxythreonine-4-phosphate dehydrogenase PdxA [Candidimonas nitroreducens]
MSSHTSSLPVGITLGDAAGIGPEIIVKLHAEGLPAPTVVYGDAGVLRATIAALGLQERLRVQELSAADDVPLNGAGIIAVHNRWQPLPADLAPGRLSPQAGRGAYEYLCHAIDDAGAGRLRAIVTAPLNKKAMQAGGADYPGHTEILAERTGTQHYAMMLANPELRVILVTIHMALAEVPRHITLEQELTTLRLADLACRQAGLAAPRVAVAGLNPHAGEDGRFGREEIEVIAPAIAQARAEGIDASGPWPGDTVFMRARQGEFDIVVAQYHDQGLIPVKYLGIDHGVNVTVGLPFVRTSVDHGTAFDIAGRGIADPRSLRAAYDMALAMTAGQQPA